MTQEEQNNQSSAKTFLPKKSSTFVVILLLTVWFLLTVSFLIMGNSVAAIATFFFFFFFWALLQVDRDQNLIISRTHWYFIFIRITGLSLIPIALYSFLTNMLGSQYDYAIQSLCAFIYISGIIWKFRGDWAKWI